MLDAIIIEPVLEKRSHFRELAKKLCKSVAVSSSLQEGAEKIRSLKNCDVVYVSSRFDFESAKQFVIGCKRTNVAKDSANLLIGEALSESNLAKLSLSGFDGVLIEPATLEAFKASTEVALRARSEKLKLRTKKSMDILVKSLAAQIDELYVKKKTGHLFFMAQEKLKNLGKEIRSLDSDTLALYFETITELFPDSSPVNIPGSEVKPVSKGLLMRHLSK